MDREIRILHTADTHLGYKQYHNEVRRKDFFAAFELVINDAVEMQVDAVVHAGDLFDSRNPTLEDLLETINILSKLKAANIPFFGIVGNHESKQNTQWLDLFEEMGLAARLGKKPRIIGNAAIYGIDSVPKSKIPSFDYSGFEAPDSTPISESESFVNYRKLLVMHQIVQPFPYAEWNCAVVLENLPFEVDAILLGDYHKYEKFKVGEETWATYPGSTERNSASEEEARSYNIVTLSGDGIEISKRTIPTRNFFSIPAELNGEENPHEQIFSKINERLEELSESVVTVLISGDSKAVLSFSEIEEYLLNKGALVPRIKDLRIKETLPEEVLKVTFSDPDQTVATEIKRMDLNDGGLIIDEIIRNPHVLKSRVDEETENRLSRLIEAIDFKDPDFRVGATASSAYSAGFSESLPETMKFTSLPPEPSKISEPPLAHNKDFELESKSVSELGSGYEPQSKVKSELKPKSGSESNLGLESKPEFEPGFESEILSEAESEIRSKYADESSEKISLKHEKETEPSSETGFSSKSPSESGFSSRPEFTLETPVEPISLQETPENLLEEPERELNAINKAGEKPQEKIEAPQEVKAKTEPENRTISEQVNEQAELDKKGKEEIEEEKVAKSTESSGKRVKTGQKREKAKPAAPRQYNLGDYL